MRSLALTIVLLALAGCCKCPDPTLAADYLVASDKILSGRTYFVYPNQDLAAQGCRRSAAFPGKILCRRESTYVFDDPRQ